ncbi:MAG: oligosaccharide flippase family protein [Lachnospiraceae bacterium]|nr:oligosaccharide flippase family protein [Lachnospiraceae bacterium]
MEKNNSPLKAGVGYTISNFIVKGMVFLTTPIFTRLMTSEDIGSYSNIQSWFSILAILVTVELYSSVQLAQFDYKDCLDEYIASNLILGTIITGAFYSIILIFKNFFVGLFLIDFDMINILFIYLLVYPAIQMFQIRNQLRFDYIPNMVVSIGSSVVATVVSLILAIVCNDALRGRVYGYYVPLIIITAFIYIFLIVRAKGRISNKYWRYALSISFPLIWHLLASNILNSSDRIMINSMIGSEENALYSVAYSCAMIVALLWSSMNSAWSPWAYQRMDAEEYLELKNKSKPYTIFFLAVVFCFMLLAPEILLIMGGRSYLSAVYVIPPVMVGYVFQFIYSLYVNIEFYHKKQVNVAIGTIIAAIINIALNYIFIPRFGYIAAAYTTLIGYFILLVIHYMFVLKLKKTKWYDTAFFIKCILITLVGMGCALLFYRLNRIRYCLIVVLLVITIFVIIKYNKVLLRCIKNRDLSELKKINVLKRIIK